MQTVMQKVKISPSSVFLVSGGAKGITAQCAIRLAQRQPCKFILLGRSAIVETEPNWARDCFDEFELKRRIMQDISATGEKPIPAKVQKVFNSLSSSREIKATLQAIRQAGGQVEYISVDVTNALALKEKVAAVVERVGAITGIIHGAGNLADKLIDKKTEQDFESVYTAKVKGLENILNCVSIGQLDYLVLFSSVTGFYGNIGQSDYAIANEILNKSAHLVKRHYPNCHVVAINWGPWDSGMVTPELKKAFTERNIEIIPVEAGTEMLVNELNTANHATTQVVIGSPLVLPATGLKPVMQTYCIRRKLTLEANPFLHDHVIAGNPVLPATCAMSWMINVCEQLYPGYKFFSCTNFKILKGIVFDQALASEYILELKEIAKTDSSEIEFEAKIWSKTQTEKLRYHYTAQLKLVRQIPLAPNYHSLNLDIDRKITDSDQAFYESNGRFKLFHGASFQGVKNVLNITSEKITVQCNWPTLGERQQGQFQSQTFNPFLADIQSHAIWIWLQYFHQQICLPSQTPKFEIYADIPCGEPFYVSTEIKSKTDINVVADFITHNRQGQIYSRLLGGKATIFSWDY